MTISMTETLLRKIADALALEPSEAVRREVCGSLFGHGGLAGEPYAEKLAKALAIPHVVDDDSPVYECREVVALRDRGWVRVNNPRKAQA